MPVLGGVSILDNDDFLDRFLVAGLQTLALNAGVVVVLAFNEEVVGTGTSAANVEACTVGEIALGHRGDARKSQRQLIGIQAGDGKAADLHLADRAVDLTVVRIQYRVVSR